MSELRCGSLFWRGRWVGPRVVPGRLPKANPNQRCSRFDPPSITVMAFQSMSDDPEREYLPCGACASPRTRLKLNAGRPRRHRCEELRRISRNGPAVSRCSNNAATR